MSNRKTKLGILTPGTKINRLTLLTYHKGSKWECQCDCGKIITLRTGTIISGNNKSCGCFKKEEQKIKVLEVVKKNVKNISPKIQMSKSIFREDYSNGDLTYEEFLEKSQMNCFYCGTVPLGKRTGKISRFTNFTEEDATFRFNGLDRLDPSLLHLKSNVVPCCKWCNNAKKQMSVQKFLEHMKKIQNVKYNPIVINSKPLSIGSFRRSVNAAFVIMYKKDSDLTLEEFYYVSQLNCYYCGDQPSGMYNAAGYDKKASQEAKDNGYFIYNGLDRVNNNLGHTKDNIVPCCKICNYAKWTRSLEDFNAWIEKFKKFQNFSQNME